MMFASVDDSKYKVVNDLLHYCKREPTPPNAAMETWEVESHRQCPDDGRVAPKQMRIIGD